MRTPFVRSLLETLLRDGTLSRDSPVLVVCGGKAEHAVFRELGFTDVTITNLDREQSAEELGPYRYSVQDAQCLDYEDESFEFSFVADGLHHCASPHRAMLEMYRVARRGIIVIETRDSLVMRLANRLGLSPVYEVGAVTDNECRCGGVNNSDIPNFIYRWTESDFKKTLNAFNPTGSHRFCFFYGLSLPDRSTHPQTSSFKLAAIRLIGPFLAALTLVVRRQGNLFGMVGTKPRLPDDLWPWLKLGDEGAMFDREYGRRRGD